ncbi:trypsin-4-like [Schistocerca gregaria]|uniref:trypsin-4-like n=1 Tax=Schistocerca gregaria TaxID=7010 RepID=UPI00211EDF53|nr:trypsin-4-like [Schistocerca gregaria]
MARIYGILLIIAVGGMVHSECLLRKRHSTLNGLLRREGAGDTVGFPWHVFVLRPFTACSGSIISSDWALTAAHCVAHTSPWLLMLLAAGAGARLSAVHFVSSYVLHGDYDAFSRRYDIAVMRVYQPFLFTDTVKPIALPTDQVTAGTTGMLIEFCHTADGKDGPVATNSTVLSWDECDAMYGLALRPTMVCAVATADRGHPPMCVAEAGGALVAADGVQLGVRAWPATWNTLQRPADVYVNVADVRDWIREVCGV